MITIKESLYDNDRTKVLNIELIQDLVNTVQIGAILTVIGVIKHVNDKSQKFLKQNESKYLKSYLKCFTVEMRYQVSPDAEITSTTHSEFLQTMKTEPSPFQVLVNSLCPKIYGRDEVKAGLVLALLSGNDLNKFRRSESHILLVGNPGAGKSELLKFCAEVSQKGMFVCGPTLTAAGLFGAVGNNGTIDAGSLILTDGGACCIDEFDKMSHSHILLESMEQGVVSIMKCGVNVNMSSRAVVIAAANPISSIYDKTKTILENVRIKTPLMSRFDLVFALERISRADDEKFLAHVNSKNLSSASSNSSFFSTSTVLSMALLKFYIGYARENLKPKLSEEAKAEIKHFYLELRAINTGVSVQVVTHRQIEAVIRLTLARARADLAEIGTREHALEVIKIVKYSMIDLFAPDDKFDSSSSVASLGTKKLRTENLSSLSKPKQLKAFREHLENEAELQNREQFSTAELKAMAKELGIKEFYEIVDKLNHEGFILKTPDGYRVA